MGLSKCLTYDVGPARVSRRQVILGTTFETSSDFGHYIVGQVNARTRAITPDPRPRDLVW